MTMMSLGFDVISFVITWCPLYLKWYVLFRRGISAVMGWCLLFLMWYCLFWWDIVCNFLLGMLFISLIIVWNERAGAWPLG